MKAYLTERRAFEFLPEAASPRALAGSIHDLQKPGCPSCSRVLAQRFSFASESLILNTRLNTPKRTRQSRSSGAIVGSVTAIQAAHRIWQRFLSTLRIFFFSLVCSDNSRAVHLGSTAEDPGRGLGCVKEAEQARKRRA